MGDRDPIIEVLWEKKAVDTGAGRGARTIHVDDAVVRLRGDRWVYTQVKETVPAGGWTARNLIKSGVAKQLWNQWQSTQPDDRRRTLLQLASGGSIAPLAIIIDAALRSRTPSELMSDETPAQAAADIEELSKHLFISESAQALLEFLKAVRAEPLPGVGEMYGWIIQSLALFGTAAGDTADHLIRIVAESKHVGGKARSSHTRTSLIGQMQEDGFEPELLAAAGLIVTGNQPDETFWRVYRAEVVKSLRRLRVYGLDIERPIFADLPALFVPLRLLPLDERKEEEIAASPTRRSFIDVLDEAAADRSGTQDEPAAGVDLSDVLADTRRFVLVGTQGCGKTTMLRWLAIIAAMEDKEASHTRLRFGLPPEPLLPLFVRFRRLADRVRALKLQGIRGRVGLVADFLAAEFQAGVGEHAFSQTQALRTAYELLESKNTLFLFDALDEVADVPMRNQLLQAVADLVEKYPEPRIVMSSRPYALRQEDLQVDLPRYSPLPFDLNATDTFCEQWYRAVRVHLGDDLSEKEAKQGAAHLAQEARRVPDLAESPLLLSILALVHFNRDGLPIERTKLYDYATLAMLGHWDRDPARSPDDDAIPSDWADTLKLEESDVRSIVERLAHDVQVSKAGSEFTTEQALKSLKRGMNAVPGQTGASDDRARLLLRLLLDRSGLVQERSAGVCGFAHLGFQEYLAARWFVGHGKGSLADLAKHATEERHAEVVRFAAGILTSDRTEQNEKQARDLVLAVARHNAMLAGVCLLEAPHLQIDEEEECEELARAAWTDAGRHFYHRTDISARVIWALLGRTSQADRLLLEMIAQDDHSRRGPMGPEATYALLACRPAMPMTPELCWFVRRLSDVDDAHGPPLAPICELLLVEAGADPVGEHVSGLIALLRPSDWPFRSRSARGSLADRAGRLLREELATPSTAQPILAALYSALLKTPDCRCTVEVADLLLSVGEPMTAELADALVERGVQECQWNSDSRSRLVRMASAPETRELVLSRLTDALTHDDNSVREGAISVLEELGMSAAAPPPTSPSAWRTASVERLVELLADPSTADDVASTLADELWLDAAEEKDRVWKAATALLAADYTRLPGLPRALVMVGLASTAWRETAATYLRRMRVDPRRELSVRASLLDALQSERDAVAAAAAGILTDTGDTTGKKRVKQVVEAALRDPEQIAEMLPRLKGLLNGTQSEAVVEAIGEYLNADPKSRVAGSVAKLLAEAGRLDAPHVAKGLALGGLSDAGAHDDVIPLLRRMLDDSRLVTDTRTALSEALESHHNENATWGAVRCLWKAGLRYDPNLVPGLLRAGLQSRSEARAQEAREMLLALMKDPMTAPSTVAAVRQHIVDLLSWREKKHEEAWPAAECLLRTGVFDDEHLPEVLVQGGLGDRENYEQVLDNVRRGVCGNPVFAQALEKELWGAVQVQEKPRKESWRAVAMLNAVFRPSLEQAMMDTDKRYAVIRVLVGEAEDDPVASVLLTDLTRDPDAISRVKKTLVCLLQDKEHTIAFSAACRLAKQGDLQHVLLPKAVVSGGLGHQAKRVKAKQFLDNLWAKPAMVVPVRAALREALWGQDAQVAWHASLYLIERGERVDSGIARGLVRGGLSHDWRAPRTEAQRRLRALLRDPAARGAAEEALVSGLFVSDGGHRLCFEVASLLTGAGVDVAEALAAAADEHMRWLAAPTLALVVLSGRIAETRAAARRLGSHGLLEILGAEDEPS